MNKPQCKILFVEDTKSDFELIERALTKANMNHVSKRVETKEGFLREIKEFIPSIVLCDYSLPSFNGMEAFQLLKEQKLQIPFILVTGALSEQLAIDCLREGVDDFVLKTSYVRLPTAIVKAIEKKKAEEELQKAGILLKENEKKLKEAQAIAHIGNWEIDLATQKHVWSDELYNILGVNKEETIISTEQFLSFIHPDDREFTSKKISEALSSFSDSSFTFRFFSKDRLVCYGYSEYKFEFDENAKPLRLYGIIQDITERKKAEKEILKKNKQLRNLSNHLQNIREEERTSVAREIHDELGQQLTALKMDIDWILHKQNNIDKAIISKLQEMLKMNDGIINTVRRISSDLRPAIIDDFGLVATIEWKCSDFEEKTGLSCRFISTIKEKNFDKQFSINVYRILQETLTNVSRHSGAKSVTVLLTESQEELILEIIDDGKGITAENIRNSKKLGILGMKERAGLLGGKLTINGTVNKGTQVKLTLPF